MTEDTRDDATVHDIATQVGAWSNTLRYPNAPSVRVTSFTDAQLSAFAAALSAPGRETTPTPERRFFEWSMRRFWEGVGFDGPEIQEEAERLGLIVLTEIGEPCGEHCTCAEVGERAPWKCYRLAQVAVSPEPSEEAVRAAVEADDPVLLRKGTRDE